MHVSELNLSEANDNTIWETARNEYHAIVTKDSDFYYKICLNGALPRLIWRKTVNCRTRELLDLIREKTVEISIFLKSDRDIMTIQ